MFKNLSIAILLAIGIPAIASAQTQTADAPAAQSPATVSGITSTSQRARSPFARSPQDEAARKLQQRIQAATKAFRNAEGSARADAEKELENALSEEYDLRLTAYDKYLDRLEQQLSDMRKKLDRRRDAKRDMVQLRIQVLAAEADDLGWPSASPGRRALWPSGQSGLIYDVRSDPFVEATGTTSSSRGR